MQTLSIVRAPFMSTTQQEAMVQTITISTLRSGLSSWEILISSRSKSRDYANGSGYVKTILYID